MAKPTIVRTEVVVVDRHELNPYNDMIFWDKADKEYKVSAKRQWLHEKVVDGVAITLGYAVYMDREYIADILDVASQLPPPVTPQKPADAPKPTAYAEKVPAHKEPAPQELGMWWKELGECIRVGAIDKDFPKMVVKIKSQYYKKLAEVTGITMKEK